MLDVTDVRPAELNSTVRLWSHGPRDHQIVKVRGLMRSSLSVPSSDQSGSLPLLTHPTDSPHCPRSPAAGSLAAARTLTRLAQMLTAAS